jgi:hypothetical protein
MIRSGRSQRALAPDTSLGDRAAALATRVQRVAGVVTRVETSGDVDSVDAATRMLAGRALAEAMSTAAGRPGAHHLVVRLTRDGEWLHFEVAAHPGDFRIAGRLLAAWGRRPRADYFGSLAR